MRRHLWMRVVTDSLLWSFYGQTYWGKSCSGKLFTQDRRRSPFTNEYHCVAWEEL